MNDFSPEGFENKDLPFVVNRLSPTIGGEILGIDLSQQIDKKTKDLIYAPKMYRGSNYVPKLRIQLSYGIVVW